MTIWNVESLKEFLGAEIRRVEASITAQSEAVRLLGAANHLAQEKFEASVSARFTSVNEFRNSLADLGATMATRRELEAFSSSTSDKIDDLRDQLGDLRSRVDIGPSELKALTQAVNESEGERAGTRATTAQIYTVIGIVAVIAGLVGHYVH